MTRAKYMPKIATASRTQAENVHLWCSESPFGSNRNVPNGTNPPTSSLICLQPTCLHGRSNTTNTCGDEGMGYDDCSSPRCLAYETASDMKTHAYKQSCTLIVTMPHRLCSVCDQCECTRSSLFLSGNCTKMYAQPGPTNETKRHSLTVRLQRGSRDPPLLPALRGKVAFCPALLTCHWLPEVELASGIPMEL